MERQRKLRDAGIREAHIVSWRVGNGPSHLEAFETQDGAEAFVKRHSLKAHIYKGVVMEGLFPRDAERAGALDAAADAAAAAAGREERDGD